MPPRPLILGLLILTVLRWVVAGAQEVTPGEAALWLCGEHPAAGYFHHGPVGAWMVRLGTMLAGDTAVGVRFFAPWVVLGASVLGWRLAASAFGGKTGAWFVAVLQLVPLVNLAAVRALPETWAFGFGVLALWWLWQALHRASRWTWHWPAAGAAMGLGALASPDGFALGVGLICLLSVPHRWRRQWRRPGPWLALSMMIAVVSPWLMWLARLDWLPWRVGWFEWRQGFGPAGFFGWIWQLVLAASPFLFAGLAWAVGGAAVAAARSWQRRRHGGLQADDPLDQKDGRVFLLAVCAPGAVWAVASALMGHGRPGMVALPGFAALLLLVARWIEVTLTPTTHRLAQNATLLLAAVYTLLALHSDLARHLGLRWSYRLDPTADTRGWKEAAMQAVAAADRIAESGGGSPAFILADRPALAAVLNFHLPTSRGETGAPSGLPACQLPQHLAIDSDFALWRSYADSPVEWQGRSALLVAESEAPVALVSLRRDFERLESFGTIEIRRGGLPVRRLTFFACRGYRGPAL